MEKYKIDRINELGRTMRTRALTVEEAEEQKKLRDEYMAEVRLALRGEGYLAYADKKTDKNKGDGKQ